MKEYIVVSKILGYHVEEAFDAPEDATQFAELMRKAHPDREYHVYAGCMLPWEAGK